MSNEMSAHGEFKLCLSHNIVIARLSGAWNKECAQAFDSHFKKIAQPLIGQRWGHLVLLDDWELGTPDLAPIIASLVEWCITNGLERSAQVYNEAMAKRFFLDQMVKEKIGNFERHIFKKEHDALEWLSQNGFTIESQEVLNELV